MDHATASMLRDTLRHNLTSDVPGMLADLGWDDVLAEDEAAATRLLFEELGRGLVASSALDAVVLRAAGLAAGPARVLYPLAGSSPEAVHGVLLGPVEDGTVVLTTAGDGGPLLELPLTGGVPADALDPDGRWCLVSAPVADARTVLGGSDAVRAWERAVAAGRRALASELVGSGRAVLDLAGDHVRERRQFGRAIGSFQSVRHRLADAHASLAGADALVGSAWTDRSPSTAAQAKAVAAGTHAEVLAHAMQVCGAMGLTWEHPLHRHARRGFALDLLLGSADELTDAAGAELLDGLDPPRFPAIDHREPA